MRERLTLRSAYLYTLFFQVSPKSVLTPLFLLSFHLAFSQPANDDCGNASNLPTDGSCQTFNNTDATHDIGNGTCVNGTNNVWFSFIAQGPDYDVSLNAPNSAFKPEVTLIEFDPTPCDFASANQLDCGQNISGSGLTAGQSYYLALTSGIDDFGEFEICLDNPVPNPAPANDDPCNASPVIPNGSCTSGTTISATPDWENPSCPNVTDNTVWYSTTLSAGNNSLNINLQTSSLSGTISINVISFSPDCNGSANIVAGGAYCGSASSASLDVSGLMAGFTYYVQIASTTMGEGDFDLCLTESGPPPGCAENDLCTDAETINVSSGSQNCISGCNTAASQGPIFSPSGSCFDFPNETVWYAYTPLSGTGIITVNVSSGDLNQPQVAIFISDCILYTPIDCNIGNAGSVTLNNVSVTPGTTYFIAVSDGAGAEGEFEICIEALEQGSNCNTDSEVTVVNTSLDSPLSGPFQPGEQVEICLNVNNFNSGQNTNGCQWFHGLVPEFGDCWDPISFSANGMPANITVPLAAAGNTSNWVWFENGAVTYNDINPGYLPPGTPVGAGWFAVGVPGNDPDCTDYNDPNCTFGDGSACDDNNGLSWQVCFMLTARQYPVCEQAPTFSDCTISFRTYGDGETGGWDSQGCEADLPWFNNLSLNCCAGPLIDPLPPQTICSGDQTSIILTSDQDPNVSYTWEVLPTPVSGAGDCNSGCSNTIAQILTNNTPDAQVVTYVVSPSSNEGCIGLPIHISVTVLPEIDITIPPVPPVCAGSCITLNPTITGGAPPYTYIWDNGAMGNNPEVCPTLSTTYNLTITDASQCSAIGHITVQANSNLEVELSADPGTRICNNDSDFPIMLNASVLAGGSGNYSYNWSPVAGAGSTQPVFDSDTYCVTVTDLSTQCTGTACLDIIVDIAPTVLIIDPGSLGICLNSFQLQGIPNDDSGVWGGVADPFGNVYPAILGEGTHEVTYTYTDPNTLCSSTANLNINVIGAPDIDSIGDFNVCNEFILPIITGTNLTGNQAYYTGSGGTGMIINEGSVINTNTTLYLYDNDGNCSDEEIINISITAQPEINDQPNIEACNFYTLPDISGTNLSGNQAYYTGTGGTGTSYQAGDIINTSTDLYIYDNNNACFDEVLFSVEIFIQPDLDEIANVTACESYTLLPITGNNLSGNESYYSGPNGTGSTFNIGDQITSTTTIYVYDNAGTVSCEDEESFTISIIDAPSIYPIQDVEVCESYTLPAIEGEHLSGNEAYFTGPNGTGIMYLAGDQINTSISLYAYDDTGISDCSTEVSFSITIVPQPVAAFSFDDLICSTGFSTISFSGSAGNNAIYNWDFEGGTILSGSGAGPYQIQWNSAGDYTITLTVEENACVSNLFTETISVIAPLAAPVINCDPSSTSISFTWEDVPGATGYNVEVINGPSGSMLGNNEYEITGLNLNAEVEISVEAIGPQPCGSSFSNLTCQTTDCPPVVIFIEEVNDICLDQTITPVNLVATISNANNTGVGIWEGPGITDAQNGVFDPAQGLIGTNPITYTYQEASCVYTESISINVYQQPSATFEIDLPICQDDTAIISYTGNASANALYNWNFGTGNIISGSGQGPYSVNWPNGDNQNISLSVIENSCSSELETQNFDIEQALSAPVIDCNTTTESIEFTWAEIPGATDYEVILISGPAGIQDNNSYLVNGLNPNDSVTIVVTALNSGICGNTSTMASCSASNCPVAIIELSASENIVCLNGNQNLINLSASVSGTNGNGTGFWTGPGVVDPINGFFDPNDPSAQAGINTLFYSYTEQNCYYSESIDIELVAPPTALFEVQSPICLDQTCTINYSGTPLNNAEFQWDFAGGTIISGSGAGPYEIAFANSGTFDVSLRILDEHGCLSPDFFQNVEVSPPLQSPVINCNTTPNSIEFTWDPVDGATDYEVEVLSGETGILNGTSYLFENLNPNQTIEIEVTALSNGVCSNTSTTQACQAIPCPPIILFIEPTPDICLTSNVAFIDLEVTILGSDGSGIGVWTGPGMINPQEGIFNPSFANIGPNEYTYTFVENGCVIIESIIININFPPTANFTASSPICIDEASEIEAIAINNGVYSWNFDGGNILSGSEAGPYQISWDDIGTYTVSLSLTDTATGCSSNMISQTVEVLEGLEPPIIYCSTSTSMIEFNWDDVDGANGYIVNVIQGPPGVQNGNSYTVENLNPDDSVTIELIVQGDAPCGDTAVSQTCYATDCANILIDLEEIPDYCQEDNLQTIILNATVTNSNTTGTGIWSGNGIIDSISGEFDPSSSELIIGANTITYTFTEQDCPFTEQMVINMLQTPEIISISADTLSCANNNNVIISSVITGSNLGLQWTGPGIVSGANSTDPTVVQAGWYFITATDNISGCNSIDSILIHQAPDIPEAIAGVDQTLNCVDTVTVLQASGSIGSNYIFNWEGPLDPSQINEQYPEVSQPGIYILTIIDTLADCSSLPDTVVVSIDSITPVAAIISPINPIDCQLQIISLKGQEVQNANYQWLDENGLLVGTEVEVQVENEGIYFFNVIDTLNGCIGTDSIEVINNTDYPIIRINDPPFLNCKIDEVELNASGSQANYNVNISWTGPPGGLSGPVDELITTATLPGSYTLTLKDTVNRCENDTTIIVIEIDDGPTAVTNTPNELDCSNNEVELNGLNSLANGPLGFEWIYNANTIALEPSILVRHTGTYGLVVRDEDNGCTDTTFVNVYRDINAIGTAIIEHRQPTCYGANDGLLLIDEVTGGIGPYLYSIDGENFDPSNIFLGLEAGEYTITIQDQEECRWDTIFTIDGPEEVLLDIGDDFYLRLGSDTTIIAQFNISESEINTLTWSANFPVSCVDSSASICDEIYLSPLEDVIITATLIDTSGCRVEDQILLKIDKENVVYIPNIFTPNGDNENDIFMLFAGEGVINVKHFFIYDRWGEIVFEGHDFLPNDPAWGWDGTLRGKRLNPAVFVYWAEIELINGQTAIFKGDITLIR